MNRTLMLFRSFVILVASCGNVSKEPATNRADQYGDELKDCNLDAGTCLQSIECENRVRAKYGRPMRDLGKGCK